MDDNGMFGSRIRVIKNPFDDGPTVYTFAIDELFDLSTDKKFLRFFSTGDKEEDRNHTWVATSKKEKVDEQTLFGNVGDNADRLNIEDTLMLYCHPLSLGQTCADWYLIRFLISRTIAGWIISDIKRLTAKELM